MAKNHYYLVVLYSYNLILVVNLIGGSSDVGKKMIVFVIVIFSILIVVYFGVFFGRQVHGENSRIIIYQKGESLELSSESPYFKELQEKCESLFVNADDELDLIVTKDTINEAKESGGIEILYSDPQEFTLQNGEYSLKNIDALLITFGNNSATIYYSMGGRYSSGPLVNTQQEDTEEAKDLLRKLGYSF